MDGPRNYHTKYSQSEIQLSYDITYMCNLKYDTNELIYKTETDSQREQTGGCQGGGGLRKGWSGRLGLADIRYEIWNG